MNKLESKDEWIRDQIKVRLERFQGNASRAAISLGMSRATFYRYMKKFKINRKKAVS